MKHDRLFTFWEAAITGFFLSFSAVACMVTAFSMTSVSMGMLALYCAGGSIVCGFLCSRRLNLLMLGLTALAAGILWQNGMLADGLESLLYQLSRVYHDAYNWQIIQWSWRDAEELEQTLAPMIYILGAFVAMITAWTVCKGQSSIVACVPAALPVMACFVVTDSLPNTAWLILFLTVTVVMILTSATRQTDRAQGRQLALFTVLPVFLAVSVLFLAIPKETYYHQSKAQAIGDFLMGKHTLEQMLERLSGVPIMTAEKKVDLSAVGARADNATQILEVTSRHNSSILYLRTSALDRYTGTQWQDSGTPLPDLYWPKKPQSYQINEVQIKTQFAHEMLYLPYYPVSLDIQGMTRGITNTQKLNEYSVTQMFRESWTVLYEDSRTISAEQRDQMQLLSQLPDSTKDWAAALARSIVGDQIDPYYQALEIAEYVKNSARYDKNTNAMPADHKDFAQWFLEESDTGYCIHFATAGAVLLKALGIPARYVTGYMVQAKAGTPTAVLASDAHAWVEYWLPGFGWAMLECTPAAIDEPSPTLPDQTGATQPPQTTPQQQPGQPNQAPAGKSQDDLHWLWWLALIPGSLTLGWLQSRLRLHLREKRRCRGNPNAQALARWAEAELLSRYLGQQPPESLRELAEKAKFSPYTLAEAELKQFDRYLLQTIKRLKRESFLRRLWHRWILALY